jgi:hypothetical protein
MVAPSRNALAATQHDFVQPVVASTQVASAVVSGKAEVSRAICASARAGSGASAARGASSAVVEGAVGVVAADVVVVALAGELGTDPSSDELAVVYAESESDTHFRMDDKGPSNSARRFGDIGAMPS